MTKRDASGIKVVATNRKAYHDYSIEDTIEAGIVLIGSEIKSIRAGRVNLRDGYASIEDGKVWMYNTHIAPYDPATAYPGSHHGTLRANHDRLPSRTITRF